MHTYVYGAIHVKTTFCHTPPQWGGRVNIPSSGGRRAWPSWLRWCNCISVLAQRMEICILLWDKLRVFWFKWRKSLSILAQVMEMCVCPDSGDRNVCVLAQVMEMYVCPDSWSETVQVLSVLSCDCTRVLPQVVEVCVSCHMERAIPYMCPDTGGATVRVS